MHLKVGELARRTGLTVRTLHHYDAIGLLQPTGRSDAGYRLYAPADVARLHAIQALRHLGLALADIGLLLDGAQAAPEAILEQQMQALDQQIRQATELRERLAMLREGLLRGDEPELGAWVESLSLMATYGKYFSSAELKEILGGWKALAAEWEPLRADVQAAMDRGEPVDTPAAQLLTRRWLALMHRWMGGDFDRMDRWGEMYRREPAAHGIRGAPSAAMVGYMERAIGVRLQLLEQHYGPRYRTMRVPLEQAWAEQEARVRRVMAQARPRAAQVREVVDGWLAYVDHVTGGDAQLKEKMLTLHLGNPLLLVGSPLTGESRAWLLEKVRAA